MLDMMIRGGQHVEPSTYASHIEAAWSTGVLPLQCYAVRLHERANARHGLPSAIIEDVEDEETTRLALPVAPPSVSLVSLVQLLRALRQRLVGAGMGGVGAAVRPRVCLSVAVQVRGFGVLGGLFVWVGEVLSCCRCSLHCLASSYHRSTTTTPPNHPQEDQITITEQVIHGVLCALGCPLQSTPPAPSPPSWPPSQPRSPVSAPLFSNGLDHTDPSSSPIQSAPLNLHQRPASDSGSRRASLEAPTAAAAAAAAAHAQITMACEGPSFVDWITNPIVGAALAALLPEDFALLQAAAGAVAAGAVPPALLAMQLPDGQLLAEEDAQREARCKVAMSAVQRIEAACAVDVQVRLCFCWGGGG